MANRIGPLYRSSNLQGPDFSGVNRSLASVSGQLDRWKKDIADKAAIQKEQERYNVEQNQYNAGLILDANRYATEQEQKENALLENKRRFRITNARDDLKSQTEQAKFMLDFEDRVDKKKQDSLDQIYENNQRKRTISKQKEEDTNITNAEEIKAKLYGMNRMKPKMTEEEYTNNYNSLIANGTIISPETKKQLFSKNGAIEQELSKINKYSLLPAGRERFSLRNNSIAERNALLEFKNSDEYKKAKNAESIPFDYEGYAAKNQIEASPKEILKRQLALVDETKMADDKKFDLKQSLITKYADKESATVTSNTKSNMDKAKINKLNAETKYINGGKKSKTKVSGSKSLISSINKWKQSGIGLTDGLRVNEKDYSVDPDYIEKIDDYVKENKSKSQNFYNLFEYYMESGYFNSKEDAIDETINFLNKQDK